MYLGNVSREYPSLVLKDGQDDNTDNKDQKDQKDQKVEFNDAQQSQIQKIFDSRFSKITAKHEDEKKALADENQALKDRLAALEAGDDKDGKEGKDGKDGKDKYKDIIDGVEAKRKLEETKRTNAERERDEARNEAASIRKQVAIQNAASKQQFFDLSDVMSLTANKVVYNDDYKQFVVLGEDGKPRENAKLEPMSLDEFYADFAAKRPYLVKTDAVSGAGSSENGTGKNSFGVVKSKADLKTTAQKVEYIDKFGEDAYAKLQLK
jgi:hypothetical protein